MSRKGETPLDPRDALIGSLDTGQTGCLVGRAASGARYRVYVMLGEILAAQSEEDDTNLLARLAGGDLVDAAQHEALRARVAKGGALVEPLFDMMPEQALLELLFERFRENLRAFLGAREVESFQPMDAVFTDNIQVGHDSRALLDELVAADARVAGLRTQLTMVLAPGAASPESARERHVLARCADRVRLADLLQSSGLEPGRTLEVVQDMLDRGMLVGLLPQSRKRGERADRGEGPRAESARADSTRGEASRAAPRKEPLPEPVSAPMPLPRDAEGRRAPVSVDYVPDEPTVEEPRRAVAPAQLTGIAQAAPVQASAQAAARSLPDEPVVDDDPDLAAFQDYDTARGGGAFLTDRALLDRVDLDGQEANEAPPTHSSELIEMEDAEQAGKEALKSAVSLNFSGPKLHEEEIERKLGVTNDVLATIAEAIETVEGRGAGQARLQLLVEGTSVPLAPLFKGVELSNDGRLPVALVVRNLRKRPAGEHRRLLNRACSDLIERALSAAYESLDEPGLEAMLERIAGYQQRLGV